MRKRISVLIVDDHAILREWVRTVLQAQSDIEVVGEATDGRQAVELALRLRPAAIVMDVSMPLLNGLEATRIIIGALPQTKVVIFSAQSEDAYVERATAWGAAGYLLKNSGVHLLPTAIRDVLKGRTFFGPFLAKHPRDQQPNHNHKKWSGGRAIRESRTTASRAIGWCSRDS
jgi:DNA-binding NarL/FixJ family response regulator